MSSSLRDQLLAAGLVNKTQVQKVKQQQRHQSVNKRGSAAEQKPAARQAEAAKAARDQELNRKQQEKAEKKARMAQVRQLIEQNKLPRIESDDYYNFIDGKKIKRLPVNAEVREQLMRGQLAIVRCDGRYELVLAAAADRIRERDEHAVIAGDAAAAPAPASQDENDPYKDFAVPDDLMW